MSVRSSSGKLFRIRKLTSNLNKSTANWHLMPSYCWRFQNSNITRHMTRSAMRIWARPVTTGCLRENAHSLDAQVTGHRQWRLQTSQNQCQLPHMTGSLMVRQSHSRMPVEVITSDVVVMQSQFRALGNNDTSSHIAGELLSNLSHECQFLYFGC